MFRVNGVHFSIEVAFRGKVVKLYCSTLRRLTDEAFELTDRVPGNIVSLSDNTGKSKALPTRYICFNIIQIQSTYGALER